MLASIVILVLLYGCLWYIFTLGNLPGWYALIPIWVFYCWARLVRVKHPIYSAAVTSIFIYGVNFVIRWYVRIFGVSPLDSMANSIVQNAQPTILVSHFEFFVFGLFLIAFMVGLYQFIRLCWRLAEAFSFGAWLPIMMVLAPPISLVLGLTIIVLSRRPFRILKPPT